jgi:hypothetical protein
MTKPPPDDRPAGGRPPSGRAARRRGNPPPPSPSRLATMWALVLSRFRDYLNSGTTSGDDPYD